MRIYRKRLRPEKAVEPLLPQQTYLLEISIMTYAQTAIAPQVPDDPDPEVAYILALEAKLEASVAASQAIFCDEDIEVDSSPDMFGVLYRVWRGIQGATSAL
jgi:hypothetical protein